VRQEKKVTVDVVAAAVVDDVDGVRKTSNTITNSTLSRVAVGYE